MIKNRKMEMKFLVIILIVLKTVKVLIKTESVVDDENTVENLLNFCKMNFYKMKIKINKV